MNSSQLIRRAPDIIAKPYAELESVTPESQPDPLVNTDGKPKLIKRPASDKPRLSKKRKRRAEPQ